MKNNDDNNKMQQDIKIFEKKKIESTQKILATVV